MPRGGVLAQDIRTRTQVQGYARSVGLDVSLKPPLLEPDDELLRKLRLDLRLELLDACLRTSQLRLNLLSRDAKGVRFDATRNAHEQDAAFEARAEQAP